MLTVADLLAEPALGLRLVTGPADAARRRLLGAAVVEVESPARWIERQWVLLTAGVRLEGASEDEAEAAVLRHELAEARAGSPHLLAERDGASSRSSRAIRRRRSCRRCRGGRTRWPASAARSPASPARPRRSATPSWRPRGRLAARSPRSRTSTSRPPDMPRLGEAFGGAGLRVDDPAAVAPALREALDRAGPTIIEVPA